jgi:hypothetical protein
MFYTNHSLGIRLQVHALPFFTQINIEDQMQVQCLLHFRENIKLICFLLLHGEETSMEYARQAFFYSKLGCQYFFW